MISLNGVTLDDDLIWDDEYSSSSIAQNIQRTILGNIIVQNLPQEKGRIINLTATSTGTSFSGSFTRSQIEDIKILEKTGAVVVFIYEAQIMNVIVQAGGVQVKPLIPRPDQVVTDLYTGTITLIEV